MINLSHAQRFRVLIEKSGRNDKKFSFIPGNLVNYEDAKLQWVLEHKNVLKEKS